MSNSGRIVFGAVVVSLAALVAFAGRPVLPASADPQEDPVARVEGATSGHVDVLASLLAKVPERVQPDLRRALRAARKGHETVVAALEQGLDQPGAQAAGRPGARGVIRARWAVSSSFRKSIATLRDLNGRVPEESSAGVREALGRVQRHRQVALEGLARLLPVRTDGGGASDLGERDESAKKESQRTQPVGSTCRPHPPSADKPSARP